MANIIDNLKSRLRIWLSIPETVNAFLVGTTSLNTTERDRPASLCVPDSNHNSNFIFFFRSQLTLEIL